MASVKNLEAASRIYCQREVTDIVMDYRLVTAIAEALDAKDAEIEQLRLELVGEDKARHLLIAGMGASEEARVELKLGNRRLTEELAAARAARETVWLLTTGDDEDGNEWSLEGVYSTQEAADAARANHPSMNVEVWPLES